MDGDFIMIWIEQNLGGEKFLAILGVKDLGVWGKKRRVVNPNENKLISSTAFKKMIELEQDRVISQI